MIEFILPFALPTLNEQISAARANRYASAALKRKSDRRVKHAILSQINPIPHFESIELNIIWVESPKPRDPDNVFAGVKFILDAIVKAGIIDDDDRNHITGIRNSIIIEKSRGIIVRIYEGGI